jgi:hypothetical protein
MKLTKTEPRPANDPHKTLVWAYWLRYLLAPGTPTAPGEVVDLGELGSAPDKNWERPKGPYSPAVKISGVKFQNEVPRIAFVNDLEEPERQPEFWKTYETN